MSVLFFMDKKQKNYLNRISKQVGQKYNQLTICEISKEKSKDNRVQILCKCECGNSSLIELRKVVSGNTKTCGCGIGCNFSHNKIDMTGKKIGRVTVIKQQGTIRGKISWLCQCDCGNQKVISGTLLRRGESVSCGCLIMDTVTKHGGISTRLYKIWHGMKERCKTQTNSQWKHIYAGKGIKVCPEWADDFVLFREWAIKNGYSDELSIDRVDSNGDYSPKNCRWATPKEQSRNTSRNIIFNGEYAADANERLGGAPNLISVRLRQGWSLKEAFTIPLRGRR
jgi:hypothetical protein